MPNDMAEWQKIVFGFMVGGLLAFIALMVNRIMAHTAEIASLSREAAVMERRVKQLEQVMHLDCEE